jgi:hypothetical protein
MSKVSWCIVIYGVLLMACDLIDRAGGLALRVAEPTVVPCWTWGILVVAAGMASAQGRRSLRLTGLWLGTIFPITLAWLFVMHTWRLWAAQDPSAQASATLAGAFLALLSVIVLACIAQLRPREGIASRGYAVPLEPARRPPAQPDQPQTQTRSEAG